MKRSSVNMLEGSILKGLLTIAVPVMVMNVLQNLFGLIDMSVLKTFQGATATAVGAVGVGGPLITLITGLVIGISAGANVVIAKHIGSGDKESVRRATGSSLAFSLAAGAGIAAVGILGARLFLEWVNCPQVLMREAVLYFRLFFLGVPILMLYNFSAAVLRSVGDSTRPSLYLTLGGMIKIAFSFLFIGAFHWGVAGVALSTILSWSVAAGLCMRSLFKSREVIRINLSQIRFCKGELNQILRIGVPAGLQQGLYCVANVAISTAVNGFGADAATGVAIANQYDGILYQICIAPALAVMSYVSQNIGHGNGKRALRSIGIGMLITLTVGVVFGFLSAYFSPQLSSLVSNSPAVIAFSRQKMIIISSTYFICGINEILGSALRGMGKPMAATASTLVFLCALRFAWVWWVFPLLPNLTFLYLVWPLGWTLSIVALLFVFFPAAKKVRRLSCAE